MLLLTVVQWFKGRPVPNWIQATKEKRWFHEQGFCRSTRSRTCCRGARSRPSNHTSCGFHHVSPSDPSSVPLSAGGSPLSCGRTARLLCQTWCGFSCSSSSSSSRQRWSRQRFLPILQEWSPEPRNSTSRLPSERPTTCKLRPGETARSPGNLCSCLWQNTKGTLHEEHRCHMFYTRNKELEELSSS